MGSLRGVAQPGLERRVRDAEVAGSNPAAPTSLSQRIPPKWLRLGRLEGFGWHARPECRRPGTAGSPD